MLIKHKVIFFREQVLSHEQLVAFARNFGEIELMPYGTVPGHPEIARIEINHEQPPLGTNRWHSDASGTATPCMGAILYALEVPEIGGDTLFANMEAAYQGLPEEIKQRIDELVAEHDEYGFSKALNPDWQAAHRTAPAEHPVVRTHPESGEKILYVNSMLTTRIKGVSEEEGEKLLAYLCAQAAIPEYQVRFKWRKNSIAFWDNRSAQHYAAADYWPAIRRMERISFAGDKPF